MAKIQHNLTKLFQNCISLSQDFVVPKTEYAESFVLEPVVTAGICGLIVLATISLDYKP